MSTVKRQVFPRRPFRLPSRGESYKTPPPPLTRGGWVGSSGGKAGKGLSTPPLTRGGWVGSFYASPYEGEEGWSWEPLMKCFIFFQLFPNSSLHRGREKCFFLQLFPNPSLHKGREKCFFLQLFPNPSLHKGREITCSL